MERHRRLPPLTKIENDAVKAVKRGNTACSTHLVDLGIIPKEADRRTHDALRRVAKRMELYTPGAWIGKIGLVIFQDPSLE